MLCLGVGAWYFFAGDESWQTMIFTSLAFAQIGQALAARSRQDSLFALGLRTNALLIGMIVAVTSLQLLVIYAAPLQGFFETKPLSLADLGICSAIGAAIFATMEIEKKLSKMRSEPLADLAGRAPAEGISR